MPRNLETLETSKAGIEGSKGELGDVVASADDADQDQWHLPKMP